MWLKNLAIIIYLLEKLCRPATTPPMKAYRDSYMYGNRKYLNVTLKNLEKSAFFSSQLSFNNMAKTK